ncbi:MAG: type I DNA topoisomerase [Gemmataceae bacterium]|nr:type I DNA topoisomerase [Gemmataceae bacterium]
MAAARKKKKNLVIVESPAKAKTINKYLGPDYEVVASKGHVRDLPKSRFGIDIEGGWTATYRVLDDRRELIADLKKRASAAGMVYLAPDPDREGEAIAWHLREALGLKDAKVQRVTFNEITKKAVEKAFAEPRKIDDQLVAAQEARRFLDRIVGYQLSPLLSRTMAEKLSAGRVQSVAVRLICEREDEIERFVPEEYWKVFAIVRPESLGAAPAVVAKIKKSSAKKQVADIAEEEGDGKDGEVKATKTDEVPDGAFQTDLAEWDGKKFEATSQAQAEPIVRELEKAAWLVSKIEQKDRQERPPAPFTTSTLQQQASLRLRFAAKRTMTIAQKLYEGKEMGSEGSVALITYMRTDSTRLSDDAVTACRGFIESTYGKPYLPDAPVKYESSKDAQGAHEAIRPTDVAYTPERVAPYLTAEELKLYTLIYNRFVACQMKPAVFAVTSVEIAAGKAVFKATGRTLKFDGFRRVLVPGKSEDTLLPPLKEKEKLAPLNLAASQHFTEPPPRYNEASLVKTLEKEGIGRPSTYAAIMSKIVERTYVELKERRFFATVLGRKANGLLIEHFPQVMDLKFTRRMEEELDQIETGKFQRNEVLAEFYEPFSQAIKTAETKMLADAEKCPLCQAPLAKRFSKFGQFFGCSRHPECSYIKRAGGNEPTEPPKTTEHKCPDCGEVLMEHTGPRGTYLRCETCKMKVVLDAAGKAVAASRPTEHVCEKCGKPLLLRQGPRGQFLACSGYPKCKNAMDADAQGNPVKPADTGIVCEKCNSPMLIKMSWRGPFLGCSSYPKCRGTKSINAELREKLKHLIPDAPPKKAPIKIDVGESCPNCGKNLAVRTRKRDGGFFLGCTGWPKCRTTKEPTPEQLEGIQKQMEAAKAAG